MSSGFSVLEVLVVMSIIGFLASILLPSLSSAREQARTVVCASNLQQILLANAFYAEDHKGVYCPGASEFLKNLHRWHGLRQSANQPFKSDSGPLVPYLGKDGLIRKCPTFPSNEIAEVSGGFERGNGGYGYNNAFIGVRVRQWSPGTFTVLSDRAGALRSHVRRPAQTLMFSDAAFAGVALIEYSFAEPRFFPQYPTFRAEASVHFRHRKLANVAWCDGHVDAHRRTLTVTSGLYPTDPGRLDIGWFGKADDNSLFDLQ